MLSVRVTIPLAFWVWSDRRRMPLKNIPININSKLNGLATYIGEHNYVNEVSLPQYKSYTSVRSVIYVIQATKTGRYKKTTPDQILFEQIHEDIIRIHNRHIEVLRTRLKAWQFEKLSTGTAPLRDLDSWKMEYRFGPRGRYKRFDASPPISFVDILNSQNHNTVHIDRDDIEDVTELLGDGTKEVSVLDELLAQAKAFEVNRNLRLSIFNYVAALELALRQYLLKKMPQKIEPVPEVKEIKKFLLSSSTDLEQKIKIILPLLIDKSWFKGIDLNSVIKVIHARNKIAHEGLLDLDRKFPETDWKKALNNLALLIDNLKDLDYLFDSSPEARYIKDEFYKVFTKYPQVWLYSKYHKTSLEIILFSDDNKSEEHLKTMLKETIRIRKEQVTRFDPKRHLTISFFKYPRERFATYRDGKWLYSRKSI